MVMLQNVEQKVSAIGARGLYILILWCLAFFHTFNHTWSYRMFLLAQNYSSLPTFLDHGTSPMFRVSLYLQSIYRIHRYCTIYTNRVSTPRAWLRRIGQLWQLSNVDLWRDKVRTSYPSDSPTAQCCSLTRTLLLSPPPFVLMFLRDFLQ